MENIEIPLKNKRFIEEIILFMGLGLSLIGMGITDFSPFESHRYWSLMIILFALPALVWAGPEKNIGTSILKN